MKSSLIFIFSVVTSALFITSSLFAQDTPTAQNLPPRPRILGISHVAINTSNPRVALAFYQDYLGFAQPYSLKRPDGTDWITFIKVNDEQYFEVFAAPAQSHGAFNHFALYTDDVTAMQEYLSAKGVRLAEPVRTTRTGDALLSVRDPGGNLIEIVQYQSGSWRDGARGRFLPATRASDHIKHLGLVVRNPVPVVRFYRDILGFEQIPTPRGVAGQPYSIRLRVPDGSDYLEFLVDGGNVSAHQVRTQDYVGLLSSDVRRTVAILQARPHPQSYGRPMAPSGSPLRTILFDPDGTELELMGSEAGNTPAQ